MRRMLKLWIIFIFIYIYIWAVAQTISYEVSLALILLSFIFLVGSYNLISFYYFQSYIWILFLTFPLSIVWFTSCLAETNRTPFDFSEGESELVLGFNVPQGTKKEQIGRRRKCDIDFKVYNVPCSFLFQVSLTDLLIILWPRHLQCKL